MAAKDPRVDTYLSSHAAFARPILEHLRALIHATGPGLEETIKWGHVFYVGRGPVCHLAAFKRHVAMGFWKHRVVPASESKAGEAMGVLGRIRSLEDLPSSRILAGYIKQAMALDAAGPGAADRPRPSPKPLPKVPTALTAALQKNARARKFFAALPPGHRREYLDWIVGAKQEATRDRRVATAVQWLAEGKHHNWRYEAGKGATKTRPKPAASAKRKSAARKPASKRAAVRPGGR